MKLSNSLATVTSVVAPPDVVFRKNPICNSIVIFDSRVDDLPHLLNGLKPGIRSHVLNPDQDGVEQISELLQQQPTASLMLVGHGFPGGLQLGAGTLDLSNVPRYASQLETWFTDIKAPQLTLLACHSAAGDGGTEFIEQLATLTGAEVIASASTVGNGQWPTTVEQTFESSALAFYKATLGVIFNTDFKDGRGGINELNNASSVTVSPDGKQVYVTSAEDDALTVFDRDAATGTLTFKTFFKDGRDGVNRLEVPNSVAVSPDNKQVFVAASSDDSLTVFDRDAATGTLTFNTFFRDGRDGVNQLDGATSVAVSPDGKQVFVISFIDDSLTVFDRDATAGTLTFKTAFKNARGGINLMDRPEDVTVSPDGKQVFVASSWSHSLTVFDRNAVSGALTFKTAFRDGQGGFNLLRSATSVAVSPDGKHVFVASSGDDSLTVFNRDADSGTLTFNTAFQDGQGDVNLLDRAYDVTVSPNGQYVFVLGRSDNALTVFDRDADSGTLTFKTFFKDGRDGVNLLGGATSVAVSPDSQQVFVASVTDDSLTVFDIDNTAPTTTSFTRKTPNDATTNADTLTFLATFNEDVTGVDNNDFAVTGLTGSTLVVTQVTALTYDVTISGGDLASFNGEVGLNFVASPTITDIAGNALPNTEPVIDETYTLENIAPVLSSFTRKIPNDATTTSDILTFLATFSEDVNNVDAADFIVTGSTATITAVTQLTPITYDITVTGGDLTDLNGTIGLDLAAGQDIIDAASNALPTDEPLTDETYTVDNAPLLTIIRRKTPNDAATSADSLLFQVTFNEAVQNVDAADFLVNGTTAATITDVTQISPDVYDITVSGGDLADFNGTVGLDLAANQDITDTASNALPVGEPSTDEIYTVNNAPLINSIRRKTPNDATTSADSLIFQATFNEAVQNVDAADFLVNGSTTATITDVTQISPNVYDITVSGGDLADFNGTVGLDLAAGQNIIDSASNALSTDEPATDETYTLTNVSAEAQLTPVSDAAVLEVTHLGSADTIRLEIEQVNIAEVGEILIFSTDATGSNRTQIGNFSLLEGGQLPATYVPGLTVDSSEVTDGRYLQFELIVEGVIRVATMTSTSTTEISLEFGEGTIFKVELFNQTTTTNLLVDDAIAIDLTGQVGNVNVNFTVYREAAMDSMVGLYTTDFADGGIITDVLTGTILRPGDAGYQEAALAKQLNVQLTGQNGQVSTFATTITGGGYLATFLIADGISPAADNIYFSHAGVNASNNDHVKLLGDNIFGFEDMSGLGDQDYNDVVVEFAIA